MGHIERAQALLKHRQWRFQVRIVSERWSGGRKTTEGGNRHRGKEGECTMPRELAEQLILWRRSVVFAAVAGGRAGVIRAGWREDDAL
jgi:hypothetical protein